MSGSADPARCELVIVRRRAGSQDEGHHGGVWKIAYADFMTAMMAFFLVMWLINAADRQTLTAIASYFNPVKLSEHVTNPRGLHDMQSGARGQRDAPGESRSDEGTSKGDPRAEPVARPRHSEAELFSDPYGVLAKLAALAAPDPMPGANGRTEGERASGEAFRDPFEPEFRLPSQNNPAAPAEEDSSTRIAREGLARVESGPLAEGGAARRVSILHPAEGQPETGDGPDPDRSADRTSGVADAAPSRVGPEVVVAEQMRRALARSGSAKSPHVEIQTTPEGLLISLTDESDFGMFAIASAEPRPELVAVMERIAGILKDRPGPIVIRGHTDGRPFRSPHYDNWRLSTARAHMAYFMLVRGGIEERRFERIEGHADRTLKVAGEPDAARNRRIEILLRKGVAS